MFFFHPSFYIVSILFQAFCVWHCVRHGKGQQWIWLIVFVPAIGCLVYLFTEVLSGRGVRDAGTTLGTLLQPGGSIGKLEKQLQFSDTVANRIQLATAYAATGERDKAIGLFESCLQGPFHENDEVHLRLIPLYFDAGRFDDLVRSAGKVNRLPEFQRSRAHVCYARALDATGNIAAAEAEFQKMRGRYSFFEARYYYACLLWRQERTEAAARLFEELVAEGKQLSGAERRAAREWVRRAEDHLKTGTYSES